jgi:hypothetical protein
MSDTESTDSEPTTPGVTSAALEQRHALRGVYFRMPGNIQHHNKTSSTCINVGTHISGPMQLSVSKTAGGPIQFQRDTHTLKLDKTYDLAKDGVFAASPLVFPFQVLLSQDTVCALRKNQWEPGVRYLAKWMAYELGGGAPPPDSMFTKAIPLLERLQVFQTPPLIMYHPTLVEDEYQPAAKLLHSLFAPNIVLYSKTPPELPVDVGRQWVEYVSFTASHSSRAVYTFFEWLEVDRHVDTLHEAGLRFPNHPDRSSEVSTLLELKHESVVGNKLLSSDHFEVVDNDKFTNFFASIDQLAREEIRMDGSMSEGNADDAEMMDVDIGREPGVGQLNCQWLQPSFIVDFSAAMKSTPHPFIEHYPADLLSCLDMSGNLFCGFVQAFEGHIDTHRIPSKLIHQLMPIEEDF